MDNYDNENKINVEAFLKEIKKLKLTGREFLAIIGNSKISNTAYKEIKENPQLTYRRLVEILEASPLTPYDYQRLLRTAKERQNYKDAEKKTQNDLTFSETEKKAQNELRLSEAEKRAQNELKLSEAVKAASIRIEENREVENKNNIRPKEIQSRGDYALAYKPEFDDFYSEKNVDEEKIPLFSVKTADKPNYSSSAKPNGVLFDINDKRNVHYGYKDADVFVKALNEKKHGSEYGKEEDTSEYEDNDYENNDEYENDDENEKNNNENYYDDYGEEKNNKGKIIFSLVFGFLLLIFSFGIRYYYTGSFLLNEQKTVIAQAPSDYTELARLLYGLDNTPYILQEQNETYGNYYIDLSEDNFKRDKICNNDRYIFNVADNTLFCVEPNTSNGSIKQSGLIKKNGVEIIEIFLFEQRLYMISAGEYESEYYSENPLSAETEPQLTDNGEEIQTEPVRGSFTQPYTLISVFDAVDFMEKPLAEFELDGEYDSYIINNKDIYIFTDYYIKDAGAHDDLRAFIPSYSTDGQKKYIGIDDIFIPLTELKYSNMKAFYRIGKDLDFYAGAVLGGQNIEAYAGSRSIIFVGKNGGKTNIIAYNSEGASYAEIDGTASAETVDERNGVIRVCAELDGYSRIYIFNDMLEPLSIINSIADNEKLKSVLFDDMFIYVITDFLYIFDTSIPDDPIISNDSTANIYHDNYYRWSDRERLSLSVETNSLGKRAGISLKMYKPEKGTYAEKGIILITSEAFGAGLWNEHIRTPAEYDLNSLYFDGKMGLILLPIIYFDGISEIERYMVINYTESEGFTTAGSLIYYDWNKEIHRAVHMGNYIYTFWDKTVVSAELPNITAVSVTELNG